ncbi:MAG: taurine ABC transporter substrate-binding protein, partial [Casimicrobiaceae bacterium]
DATFIWDPVLTTVKKNGKVLMTSGDICKEGACTFDGLVVTRKFAKDNPQFMVALVKAVAKADADYRGNAKAWTGDPAKVAAVAKWTGGKPQDVASSMALYGFPSLKQQASPEWLGGGANGAAAKALAQQANFLKQQGRLNSVAPDYSKSVTVEWVTKAMH